MDVQQLLDGHPQHHHTRVVQARAAAPSPDNAYSAWQNRGPMGPNDPSDAGMGQVTPQGIAMSPQGHSRNGSYTAVSGLPPKQVTFEYLLTEGTQQRARLPMRVNIYPHDGTDSIVTTVKNFYGLYDGNGVSFEDKEGTTLIARYENFHDKMVVYVRVVDNVGSSAGTPRNSMSPRRPRLGAPFQEVHGQSISRPSSRSTRNRSASPQRSRGGRSQSASTNARSRIRPLTKSRTGSTHGSIVDHAGDIDMSDSEGGNASVTSSRRGKLETVASAEIDVANIVEGGRRKRARFDSSELPLFVPSQVPMPGSVSSISPQRRIANNPAASPFQYSNQYTFAYNTALPSPQSHNHSENSYLNGLGAVAGLGNPSYGQTGARQRGTAQYGPPRQAYHGTSGGILPTPDPTIGGSVISDDEVARQLMALGDPSNFSNHGRTSTSTADDAFSGKAELASSVDESIDGSDIDEHELPEGAVYSDESSGEEYEDGHDASFKGESDPIMPEEARIEPYKSSKANGNGVAPVKPPSISSQKAVRGTKPRVPSTSKSKVKLASGFNGPMSPTSLPSQSRKASTASIHQTLPPLAADEEDLSTKPRCQRCRKSKKGCDRQRPCGRCKDAGIGIEGCISEDEGNGRKGRYGRHMGVSVKKAFTEQSPLPLTHTVQLVPGSMAAPNFVPDKNNKKRKR